jgi:lipopolysaccharide export system permease protein
VALLLGIAVVTIYNPVSARLKQRALTIETTVLGKGQTQTGKDLWIRQRSTDGQAIIRADRSSGSGATLGQVSVFEFDKAGAFIARIEARRAELKDGYWELADARLTRPGVPPESFERYLVATSLSAEQVRESILAADTIPYWDLPHAIASMQRAGFDPTRYMMQFQTLTARPLLFVAMVLVAASVSLRFFRFGGVAQMVLYGIGAGFMLYVATKLVEDLGSSGLLSTSVAAWSPAVIGSLLGTLALLYQEDG